MRYNATFLLWLVMVAALIVSANNNAAQGSPAKGPNPSTIPGMAEMDPELVKTLGVFCKEISKEKVFSSVFKYHMNRLCTEQGPGPLLLKTLIERPLLYGDVIAPHVEEQRLFREKEQISSRFFIASVRAGISAKKLYQNFLRIFDQPDSAKSLLAGLTSLTAVSKHDDKQTFHDRGLYGRYLFEYQLANVNRLAVEYEGRLDGWILEKNRIYILTSYLVKSMKNISDSRVMFAVIQGANSSFILVLAENAVKDFGEPQVADGLFRDYFNKMIQGIMNWSR